MCQNVPKECRFVPLFFGIPARSIVPFAQLSRTTVSRTTECHQKYEILSKNVTTKCAKDTKKHEIYSNHGLTRIYTDLFSPGKIKKQSDFGCFVVHFVLFSVAKGVMHPGAETIHEIQFTRYEIRYLRYASRDKLAFGGAYGVARRYEN